MGKNSLRALKIKLANLQLEIQSLIEKGLKEPGLVDAITADIASFTENVTKITKELEELNNKKVTKESISLSEIYKNIKRK